jgi:hypothetical protein
MISVAKTDRVKGGYPVDRLLARAIIDWRQLPLIIIGGLLIGAIFGEAIKILGPEQTVVIARAKSRP